MLRTSIADDASKSCYLKVVGACCGSNWRTHQWWGKPPSWRRRPFGLCYLEQLTDTELLKGLQHWWFLRLKFGVRRNSARPWRKTFSWPQGCSGKPFGNLERDSRVHPRLCLTWMENYWPELRTLSGSGRSTLRISSIWSLKTWGKTRPSPWQKSLG